MIVVYLGPHAVDHRLNPKRQFVRGVPTWIADGLGAGLPSDEYETYDPRKHTTQDKPTTIMWPKDRGLWPAATRFVTAIGVHFPASDILIQSDASADAIHAWLPGAQVTATLDARQRKLARSVDLNPTASQFWNVLTLRDYGPEGVWSLMMGWPIVDTIRDLPSLQSGVARGESCVIIPNGKNLGSSFPVLAEPLRAEASKHGIAAVAFADTEAARTAQLAAAGVVISLGDSPYALWSAAFGTPTVVILPISKMLATRTLLDRYPNVMYTSADPTALGASTAGPLMAKAYDLLLNGMPAREAVAPPPSEPARSLDELQQRHKVGPYAEDEDEGGDETEED